MTKQDHQYIKYVGEHGPVGLTTISSALALTEETIEGQIEGWLIRKGWLIKTSKGRICTYEFSKNIESIANANSKSIG